MDSHLADIKGYAGRRLVFRAVLVKLFAVHFICHQLGMRVAGLIAVKFSAPPERRLLFCCALHTADA